MADNKDSISDRERIISLLNKANIDWNDPVKNFLPPPEGSEVHVYAERGSNTNRGYSGFMTTFYFDEYGTLTAIGAWE